jgi:predicted dehydrogenase
VSVRLGVIGCGLIGKRRAAVAAADADSALVCVADANIAVAQATGSELGVPSVVAWQEVIARDDVDAVVVATPNGFLAEIAIAALESGKHVLLEKPMGRNVAEARGIADAALRTGRRVKVGFNHRYHPAIAAARAVLAAGTIGPVINIRAVYGHGGRPGYENEWRGNLELAGGGEATDQGVHIFDLIHWFAGLPIEACATLQCAVWPIAPLEDNAFGLFRFPSDAVASFHTSWTQWKNRFSFEVFGSNGSVAIEGLGKSYGIERLITTVRKPEGGVPDVTEQTFTGADTSWEAEWREFCGAITSGAPYMGTPADGVAAMVMLDAVYRSARSSTFVRI